MSNLDNDQLRDLLSTFQTEAADHLQTLNQTLLQLERMALASDEQADKSRRELTLNAFRAAHSLKGAARAVNLKDIEALAHGLENVLQGARDKRLALDPAICDVLYEVLDVIQQLLQGQRVSLASLQERLAEIGGGAARKQARAATAASTVAVRKQAHAAAADSAVAVVDSSNGEAGEIRDGAGEDLIRVAVSKLDDLMAQVGELLVSKMSADQHLTDLQDIRRQLAQWPRTWHEVKSLLPRVNSDAGRQLVLLLGRHDDQMQSLAHGINILHQVMNRDTLRLGMVSSGLQDSVRRMRMLPFHTIVLALQRAVRDAARSEGKQVEFCVQGSEVELDKKVLEMLKDPLLHLLRNAVTHGIESTERRLALGKPAAGQVSIAVQQRGGEVRVMVSDDGNGFDLAALRTASARQGGPILGEDASPGDIISLAFLPGVTTTEQVTSLSGRGVGLDVVRRCLEAIQGRILVDSVLGKGVKIQLLVPTSVTMTRGLLVRTGSEHYMLPLLSVEKIIDLRADVIFTVEGQAAIRLDGRPLPLASLSAVLGRPEADQHHPDKLPAVIVCVAEQRVALLVDEVVTEQELAVLPLGKLLRRVRNVTGAALLGSGRPVIVLNPADLVKLAKSTNTKRLPLTRQDGAEVKPPTPILVVDDSITTRTLEKNILETAGFRVFTAIDGPDALKQLEEHPVELIVADIQMPQMDGFELTRQLRESADYRNLPIVLVTSLDSREDRERGLMAGADAYIVKRGFDQAELLDTIQKLL
jgi:two-component system chemotaxis sensor kinase CheA